MSLLSAFSALTLEGLIMLIGLGILRPKAVEPRVVWQPLPGSQALAVACPCNEILYHGTRGPGKTDAQIMAFRKNVGRGYGRFWRGVIFDEEYKNLDDLVSKSKKWFPQFGDGAFFKESPKDYKWVWPTGEELLFRVGSVEKDYNAYHGHEYPFIAFNELTKQASRKFYDAMHSCNRSSFLPEEHTPRDEHGNFKTPDGKPLPEIPLVFFSTTNPHGPGHNWVKAEFIDRAPPGVVIRITREVFNPRTKRKEPVTRTQVHLFGSYRENRYLAPEYIAMLDGEKDPNKRKAWLEGDWNIVAGGAIDDVWDSEVHILPRFKIPASWRIDRSLDWGSTHPFSVGWWAEANGEEAEYVDAVTGETKKFCPPPRSLVRIAEWYGTKEIGSNEGLKLGAKEIAKGIKEREGILLAQGWIRDRVRAGPADNEIRAVKNKSSETIEKQMADKGVRWTKSDKSPGSRINGLELFRERLIAAKSGDGPGIWFMDHCRAAISTLPVLPRNPDIPDDVNTDAEDHVYDDTRYRVLAAANRISTNIPASYPT